jgi:hypothetical protein
MKDGSMEPFVFAGNRRRWKYLRPIVGAATVGAGFWVAVLCWLLLKAPALPSLGLGAARPTVLARVPGAPGTGPALRAPAPGYTEGTPLKRAEAGRGRNGPLTRSTRFGVAGPTVLAQAGMPLAHGLKPASRWALR